MPKVALNFEITLPFYHYKWSIPYKYGLVKRFFKKLIVNYDYFTHHRRLSQIKNSAQASTMCLDYLATPAELADGAMLAGLTGAIPAELTGGINPIPERSTGAMPEGLTTAEFKD